MQPLSHSATQPLRRSGKSGGSSHSGRVAEWLLRFREPCCTSTLIFYDFLWWDILHQQRSEFRMEGHSCFLKFLNSTWAKLPEIEVHLSVEEVKGPSFHLCHSFNLQAATTSAMCKYSFSLAWNIWNTMKHQKGNNLLSCLKFDLVMFLIVQYWNSPWRDWLQFAGLDETCSRATWGNRHSRAKSVQPEKLATLILWWLVNSDFLIEYLITANLQGSQTYSFDSSMMAGRFW